MNRRTYILVFSALAIAVNVIVGSTAANLKIPLLYLDTVGTIFVAVLFGPYWAFAVGILTNLISGITAGPTDIPFGLVNGAVGLVVGFIAAKYGFNWISAIISGLIISVVAPLIGSPIAVALFHGLTGGASDVFVMWLKQSGMDIFTATFLPRITSNFVDKILSCILVLLIVQRLPKSLKARTMVGTGAGAQHEA
ncbi:MAG: transporter component [Bacilli bacterium]|nr:transporter component [Bacilli bacterium]